MSKNFQTLNDTVKSVENIMQKFMDENLQEKVNIIKSKARDFESKMDALEWIARYANFFHPDSVHKALAVFREIYTSNDVDYR